MLENGPQPDRYSGRIADCLCPRPKLQPMSGAMIMPKADIDDVNCFPIKLVR